MLPAKKISFFCQEKRDLWDEDDIEDDAGALIEDYAKTFHNVLQTEITKNPNTLKSKDSGNDENEKNSVVNEDRTCCLYIYPS